MHATQLTDSELAEWVREGSREAFGVLYKTYFSILLPFVAERLQRISGERALQSEDVINDIFMKCWKIRHRLGEKSTLKAHIIRIAYNHMIDLYRTNQVVLADLDTSMSSDTIQNEDFIGFNERVTCCLQSISPKQSEAFYLHRVMGLTYKEICTVLGKGKKAIEKRISNAYKSLRICLKDFR